MAKFKNKQHNAPAAPQRPVDRVMAQSDSAFLPANKIVALAIFTPLLWFGLFAMLWALPFPQFSWLAKYNGFINWASFLLALSVYAYYKLSPILSYFVLFTFFGYSYIITGLQGAQQNGGLPLVWIALMAIAISLIGLLLTKTAAITWGKWLNLLLTAPVYLWAKALTLVKIKF